MAGPRLGAGTGAGLEMQLRWLQTFIAVFQTGSFTKAARRLGLSQPAVTQQIRALEKELGRPLFRRTPQGALPTPEATALAHEVKGSMAELDAAISRHFGTVPSCRPLRLGGPAELVTARVMPSISPLIADGLDVRISLGQAAQLLSDLENGHLDAVVSTIQPRARALDGVPLTDEEFVLVASPELARGLPPENRLAQELDALEKLPMISYAETLPIIRRYWRTVFDTAPPGPPAAVVPDLRAVIAAVISSAGISVLPSYLCARELTSGVLVRLLNPEIPPINTFYLATRSGTLSDPQLSRLHAHLLADSRKWT